MQDFLPSSYEVPTSSSKNYLKFEQGETRFRCLASPIVGNEFWKNKKPVRRRVGETIEVSELEINPRTNKPDMPKHFWALPVYDYKSKSVKVLEITQKGIMASITSLTKDADWGSPLEYDVTVVREGEGMETTYNVLPKPSKPLGAEIEGLWKEVKDKGFALEALFVGGDPFNSKKSEIEDIFSQGIDDPDDFGDLSEIES